MKKHKYLAHLVSPDLSESERVFTDPEDALLYARTQGLELVSLMRHDMSRPIVVSKENEHFKTSGKNPHVSILIPCRRLGEVEKDCITRCLKTDYQPYDICVLPDSPANWDGVSKISIVPTGVMRPGNKRDIGLQRASGELIAFIDSDAYPHRDWLKNGVKYFSSADVGIVGGPSLTPAEDSTAQKAGGAILSSRLGAGTLSSRYSGGSRAVEVDDVPSVNLLVRKKLLLELKNLAPDHWPGEDTHLCRLVRTNLGKKILYAPDVIVYHHRRPLFRSHLKQIWGYGVHRGHFARKFPENSRRPIYFLPSIFVLGLISGLPLSILINLPIIYGSIIAVYFGACSVEALRTRELKMSGYVLLGLFLTHITYGVAFLSGLFAKAVK